LVDRDPDLVIVHPHATILSVTQPTAPPNSPLPQQSRSAANGAAVVQQSPTGVCRIRG